MLFSKRPSIRDVLAGLVWQMALLNEKVQTMSDTLTSEIAKLQADVQAQTSTTQSAITLLQGLNAKLSAALAQGSDADKVAAIQAQLTALEGSTTALAQAVTANTPAADVDTSAPAPSADPSAAPQLATGTDTVSGAQG